MFINSMRGVFLKIKKKYEMIVGKNLVFLGESKLFIYLGIYEMLFNYSSFLE